MKLVGQFLEAICSKKNEKTPIIDLRVFVVIPIDVLHVC